MGDAPRGRLLLGVLERLGHIVSRRRQQKRRLPCFCMAKCYERATTFWALCEKSHFLMRLLACQCALLEGWRFLEADGCSTFPSEPHHFRLQRCHDSGQGHSGGLDRDGSCRLRRSGGRHCWRHYRLVHNVPALRARRHACWLMAWMGWTFRSQRRSEGVARWSRWLSPGGSSEAASVGTDDTQTTKNLKFGRRRHTLFGWRRLLSTTRRSKRARCSGRRELTHDISRFREANAAIWRS